MPAMTIETCTPAAPPPQISECHDPARDPPMRTWFDRELRSFEQTALLYLRVSTSRAGVGRGAGGCACL